MKKQIIETQKELNEVISELEKLKKTKSISNKIDLLKIKLKQLIKGKEKKKQMTEQEFISIIKSQKFLDKLNEMTDEQIEEIGLF
jgi:hypothetical protein